MELFDSVLEQLLLLGKELELVVEIVIGLNKFSNLLAYLFEDIDLKYILLLLSWRIFVQDKREFVRKMVMRAIG
jgi:hypothetical protein